MNISNMLGRWVFQEFFCETFFKSIFQKDSALIPPQLIVREVAMESHYFFSFSLRTSFAKIGSHFQLHTKEQLDQQLSAIFLESLQVGPWGWGHFQF